MNLKLVRRSTLSTLPSAPEYSETRLAPSKKKEKGKRRETEKEKRETPKHLGSGSGYPIQSVLGIGSWDIKPSSSYWLQNQPTIDWFLSEKREHSAACGWFWTCPPHSFSRWFCNQPILVSAPVVVDSKPFTLTPLFCWDWQLPRVVTRFVSESSVVTFRPYCRFPG